MSTEGRVRIGMVADTRDASFGPWSDVSLSAVWSHYVQALDRGGAAPVIFPVVEAYAERRPSSPWSSSTACCSPAGATSTPPPTAPSPNPANDASDPLRDRVELALARAAIERGICRCSASAAGCTCSTSRSAAASTSTSPTPTSVHRGEPGTFTSHPVEVVAGTRLEEILGGARGDRALAPPPGRRAARRLAARLRALARRPGRGGRDRTTTAAASPSSGTRRRTSRPAASASTTR